MQELFTRFRIPRPITSDGAKCFTGTVFSNFCINGGIKHSMGAPFYSGTHGAAESRVKLVKNFLKKNKTTCAAQLQKFFLFYRNTLHSAMHRSPAKLLLERNTRTQFDSLILSTKDLVSDGQLPQIKRHGKRQHTFVKGDMVAVRNYRDNGEKWLRPNRPHRSNDKGFVQ